jgi:4-hydroxybenzoate polyprenyltransferase
MSNAPGTAPTPTLSTYGSLVKLSHTVFALPFALAAVILASPYAHITFERVALIIVCIAAARTAAMAFNRLVDRDIDAKNPRTVDRELPRGVLTVTQVRVLVLASCTVFVAAAARLGELPLYLSPIALGLALGYSYTKRFTALCHVILGFAVAFAPGGAWIATGAPVTLAPWLLVIGVAAWVAGFDVLYSLQDKGFDEGQGLHSIPVRLGIPGALIVSALLHLVTIGCLAGAGYVLGRGVAYFVGVGLITTLLVVEHVIVRPSDLSKLNKAFFDVNGYVSLAFLLSVGVDQLLR